MALLIHGLARRDQIDTWSNPGRNSHVGRLIARMSTDWTTLFRDGTDLNDLASLLDGLFARKLRAIPFDGRGTGCREFVERAVREGTPVVLGLEGANVSHWVLVVGLNYEVHPDEGRQLRRFLILDPEADSVIITPWNGMVDTRASGGRYPYSWWSNGSPEPERVSLDTALAMCLTGRSR